MKFSIKLLKEMIKEEVLEEDLRIDKHPQADIIKKAIGDGIHLVSFSDINKVGINPGTSFNTPAGIYGWHFTGRTLRGAKKNKIFASERKYAHLLRIKNPDKALWLGTNKTGTSVKSPADAMKAFIKAYPVLNEPKIQFDPEGNIDPQWTGKDDGSRKISAAEWLQDSEVVANHSMTSNRTAGGESRSEKLYDLVMATAAVLELDTVAGKKRTIAANALLRSLGIDAVVDKECKGIVHNAETCQGFFTHKGGLEHVATIENRLYSIAKSAISRILMSPNAPEDKMWEALKALTKDFAYDLNDDDVDTGNEISPDEVLDILDYTTGGSFHNDDTPNPNLTSDMLTHIYKFVSSRRENSPLIAGRIIENILEHENVSAELLRGGLEQAIKEGNSSILAAIAANPEITPEELTKISEAGRVVNHAVQVSLGKNPNTAPEVLAKLAEMFIGDGAVAGSIVALKNPNTPVDTVNKWARRFANLSTGSGEASERAFAALSNPNVDDEIIADIIFDENVEVKEDFKTLKRVGKLENIPPEFLDEIVNYLAKGNYQQNNTTYASIQDTFTSFFDNPSLSDNHLRTLLKTYPEVIQKYDWEYLIAPTLWSVLNHDKVSRETVEVAAEMWKDKAFKLEHDDIISKGRIEAIVSAFEQKGISLDKPEMDEALMQVAEALPTQKPGTLQLSEEEVKRIYKLRKLHGHKWDEIDSVSELTNRLLTALDFSGDNDDVWYWAEHITSEHIEQFVESFWKNPTTRPSLWKKLENHPDKFIQELAADGMKEYTKWAKAEAEKNAKAMANYKASSGNQKENIQNTLRQMIKEEMGEPEGFRQIDDYYQMGSSTSEYHPAWDYAPNEDPSLLSMEAYEEVFGSAQELAGALGLGSIMIVFIEGDGVDNHVARYINGTHTSPIFVLADKVEDETEAALTLYHELGHAYVDAHGANPENEEELVENFAQIVINQGAAAGKKVLDHVLGQQKENKQVKSILTLREMVEEEVNHSKPLRQLNEISSEVYDGVVNAAANLTDEQMMPLFGNQERVLIPMKADGNEQVQAFYDNIVTPLATKGIKVNLEDGTATKEVSTQRGKQERKTRLGKAIGKELPEAAKTWWNKFQAEFLGNPDILKAKYGIVITQHPVDVARMSDFSEADIQSCHSEGADYFTCALADSKRAGAVAYLIRGEDVLHAEEFLGNNELFADENRNVEGITPISRVRLRRFDNPDLAEQGASLALLAPEARIYGERIPGFLNTVADWAREVQKGHPVFKKKLDLNKFTLRGGSYQDTASSDMFNLLVGPENVEMNPELEVYGNREGTREEGGENDIDYVEDGRSQEMIDYAIDRLESIKYDSLDHESVDFDYNVEWDDWNESVEISYEIGITFDYKFANFVGSPNLGKGTEEELLQALDREAPLSAIRLVAETAYEDSEDYNINIDLDYSARIVDQRFGTDTRKVVQFTMSANGSAYDTDGFESEVAREIESIASYHSDINSVIEEALREDGWMIETSYDKLKVDTDHAGKLGEDSFDLFSISKGPNGIAARLIIPMKGYPGAGMRSIDGVDVLYREGPKFVEIMRSDSPLWNVSGGYAILPPQRRSNILRALKREIKDAAKAAAMQPSLPMAGMPADEDKDMRPILPVIEDVQIFMKQVVLDAKSQYAAKDAAGYATQGGIMFTFKPGSSEEQIQANLKFIKYFDKNPIPVQDALQKEWNDIADGFAVAQPLVKPKRSEETNESVSSLLRNLIKEELLSEMFIKGHEDGDNIIAYKENLWKLRMDIDDDDPVRQEIEQALGIEGEWDDIWELKELFEDAGRTDILVGEFNEQDKHLSLQRSGSFHLDPKSSILVKKVVKALGARSVSYAPNDEGEEYVGRSSIKGEVADIMYHGTTSNYLPGLLRLGLVPGKKETNYEGISHPSAVFFTSRFDEAQHHAAHTAKKVGGDPVIVELKVPDPALLIPDYDVDMGAGDTGCYDYICQTLRDKQSSQSDVDANSFSLSREVGVYGYKGRVPAAAISGYYILMNAQDEMGDNMFQADREQYTEATPEEAAIYAQTKEDFGYGSLEEPEYEEEEDDWGANESILSNLRNLIKEELVR